KMGPVSLGRLESGAFRFLTDREANTLRELVEERVEMVEQGKQPSNYPKKPVRREGWARPKKKKVA
ncbi:MAG: hypothetical protein OEY86_06800, partial [Nitrospira sp.]|nr:hypothetical protein [Nitrospira sp.]